MTKKTSDQKVIWTAQPGSQTTFLACPVYECLLEGNRGPGKTDALLMDYLQHVGKGYGSDWKGVILRKTIPELADIVTKANKWIPQIFPTAKFNMNKHTWTFDGGEQLIFNFMAVVEDYWRYHGHEYAWMGWEELTNWNSDECFKRMMSVNRSSNPNIPIRLRATCNPYGVGHNWVKARYDLPCKADNSAGIGKVISSPPVNGIILKRVAIHSTIHENRILLDADPMYLARLKEATTNPAEYAAWVEGRWDITAGGMIDDIWDKHIHILPTIHPSQFPKGWRLDRAYDHGQSRPFSVGWWAESDGTPFHIPGYGTVGQIKGDLIRFDEWYGWCGQPNKGLKISTKEIARGIKDREATMLRRVRPGVADASIFDNWEPSKTVAGIMVRMGVRWLPADKSSGSRKQGWTQIRERLRGSIPNEEGTREEKGLFVMDNCVQFIRTMPVLPRDDRDLDDVDTNCEDHIADEVRYRCRAKVSKKLRVSQG